MAEVSVLAEINSYGARVCLVGETSTALRAGPSGPAYAENQPKGRFSGRCGPPDRGGVNGCPEWVKVGRGLMEARCREYEEETGHWPEMGLIQRFSAEMRKRLEDFIRDPKGHPWRAVGLREFEEEEDERSKEKSHSRH